VLKLVLRSMIHVVVVHLELCGACGKLGAVGSGALVVVVA
jgi:hypothetical protein